MKKILAIIVLAVVAVCGWGQNGVEKKDITIGQMGTYFYYEEIRISVYDNGDGSLWKMNVAAGGQYIAKIIINSDDIDRIPYGMIYESELSAIINENKIEAFDLLIKKRQTQPYIQLELAIPHRHEKGINDPWTEWDENYHYAQCKTVDITGESCGKKAKQEHSYSRYRSEGSSFYTCNECGYVNEARKLPHEHNIATEWTSDMYKHWHACLSTEGVCDHDYDSGRGEHTYGTEGEDYYTCTVCGYIDALRKDQYDEYREIQESKQEKTAAIETLVNGIASTAIAQKAESIITAINAANSIASIDQAYGNNLPDLQAMISLYNDGMAAAYTPPAGAGMRLKVTRKDGKVYEFKTQEVESVDYYRVTE